MANTTGSVKSTVTFSQAAALPGTVTSAQSIQNLNTAFNASGTAADQINTTYVNTLTFVASTPQVLDLTSLVDMYGNAISFTRVRSITVNFKSMTNGATLMLGYNAAEPANAWTGFLNATGSLTIQASTAANNAQFVLTAPNTTGMVVSGGSKALQLTPSDNAFTADITIVGANA